MLETRRMTETPFPPAIVPSPDDPKTLRSAFGRFATGVTIVTTATPDGPVAITANSFSSVSLDPPLVLWAVGRHSKRFDAFASSRHYAIHVLSAEQADLCWRFSRNGNDFSGVGVGVNAENVPLLPDCLARFECEIANRVDGGDHLILIGKVLRMSAAEGDPLVFAAGRYGRIGAVA
jgi:flavin reductase (DIM6/NTAB) family NADH-FMN oxidoreductase RutF